MSNRAIANAGITFQEAQDFDRSGKAEFASDHHKADVGLGMKLHTTLPTEAEKATLPNIPSAAEVARIPEHEIPTISSGDAGKSLKVTSGEDGYEWGDISGVAPHASSHTDGTDDIQSATNAQKGLATAAHVQAIEANTAATASLAPAVSTSIGVTYHLKIPAPGGSEQVSGVNQQPTVSLPPGTWEVVDVKWVLRGNATTGDVVGLLNKSSGYITGNNVPIQGLAIYQTKRTPKIDTRYNVLVGGTDDLQATWVNAGGNDLPPFDVHVDLRLVG